MAEPKTDLKTDRTDTFLREVDEELRRDQFQKLWDQYGIYALALAGLIVVGVGGMQWWKASRLAAREAAGTRFEAAQTLVTQGKVEEAQQIFQTIVKDSSSGYQTLARFQVAGANVKAGKTDAAIIDYDVIAKDASADPVMRDFAALQAAMLRVDSADWTEMENRLTPLMNENSPWRGMARETLGIAAFKAGKSQEAKKLFEDLLGDRTAPASTSERAMLMLSLLTDAEVSKPEAPPAVPPAGSSGAEAAKGQSPDKSAPAEKKK